jgi:hypothetical protein
MIEGITMDCNKLPILNCVEANYTATSYFRCPYDLEKINKWWVKYNTLYIIVEEGDEVESYEPYSDGATGFDWKWSNNEHLVTEDYIHYEEPPHEEDDEVTAFKYEGVVYLKEGTNILDWSTQAKMGDIVDGKVIFLKSCMDEKQ